MTRASRVARITNTSTIAPTPKPITAIAIPAMKTKSHQFGAFRAFDLANSSFAMTYTAPTPMSRKH